MSFSSYNFDTVVSLSPNNKPRPRRMPLITQTRSQKKKLKPKEQLTYLRAKTKGKG
jgi:hypothetical protein